MHVSVSVEQPLIPTRDQSNTNSISVTLEGLYSPPETWIAGGSSFIYTATVPMPLNDDVCRSILLVRILMSIF